MVFDINPDTAEIPEGWEPEDPVEAYNDFVEQGWGGPAPPEGDHDYYFKLFALADTVEYPPAIRKARMGSVLALENEILAQTQLVGKYDAEQGTIFWPPPRRSAPAGGADVSRSRHLTENAYGSFE